MKSLFLLAVVALPTVITGCVPPPPPPRRVAYVERDVIVGRPHPRRDVVVVEPRPFYGRRDVEVDVRYYSDRRGRYYWQNGRRIYVSYY
jgi:hypothetical protein